MSDSGCGKRASVKSIRKSTTFDEVVATEAERAWLQIVAWLPPIEIASLACTSRFFRKLCTTITAFRCADISRGLENYPISVKNSLENVPYPFFLYNPISLRAITCPKQPWGPYSPVSIFKQRSLDDNILTSAACFCYDCSEGCSCREASLYNQNGRLNPEIEVDSVDGFLLVIECGPACSCGSSCNYRVTQQGLRIRVNVINHPFKGWALHSLQSVPRGTFVCEYAGELLTTDSARDRQKIYDEIRLERSSFCPSLIVIREHLPSGQSCLRINIDSTVIGNVARFINHSCDGGNLLPVVVRCSGSILPRLCFFARTDISEGEELTFSYGSIRANSKVTQCFCNSSVCLGIMPSEPT